MKYYVLAQKYDRKAGEVILTVVGSFNDFMMAWLFKDSYEAEYKTKAKITEVREVEAL